MHALYYESTAVSFYLPKGRSWIDLVRLNEGVGRSWSKLKWDMSQTSLTLPHINGMRPGSLGDMATIPIPLKSPFLHLILFLYVGSGFMPFLVEGGCTSWGGGSTGWGWVDLAIVWPVHELTHPSGGPRQAEMAWLVSWRKGHFRPITQGLSSRKLR